MWWKKAGQAFKCITWRDDWVNVLYLNCRCRFHSQPTQTIDQSHRYGRPQAACRKPAGSYDKTTRTAICFEHKTQYLLIRAPYTRIVVFWHISNIPPWFRRVKLVVIPPRFILQQYLWNIAIQPAVGCYNSWANLRSSGCYPLGKNDCETSAALEDVQAIWRISWIWFILEYVWNLQYNKIQCNW